ncbi:MAG TPA: glycoside hydrolase family 15 protein [Acidimicrobiales bacterium]|nr:glycoside hydrolase family 15 protein [Acidimicrobiales bacterium]
MDDHYPAISDHGLIGDLQSAALVSTGATIDWFCAPRFDSPSIFASLLDHREGGYFRIAPTVHVLRTQQFYFPGSACLATRFITEGGVAEVVDSMPVDRPGIPSDNRRIARAARCVRGRVPFALRCEPRFDYARQSHRVALTGEGAVFEAPGQLVTLHGAGDGGATAGGGVGLDFTLDAGQARTFLLETAPAGGPRAVPTEEGIRLFEDTVRFWRAWLDRSTYRGRWRETVLRSAMALKLMTYAPTGALVAAPTAALPEQVGGSRNWDYRYTWVRDGSFSVDALARLGYLDEARTFLRWLGDRVTEQVGGPSGPLKIMYRVDGSSDLEEEVLGHLEGYMGSSPVRVGNGAADQLQLDIYGEAVDALARADDIDPMGHDGWQKLRSILDWLSQHWDQPDEGVWETRGGRRPFTYGRVMAWVAMDRAVRMAERRGRPGPVGQWVRARDAIYDQVMTTCWHPGLGAFTQQPAAEVLDAANLLMPVVGLVAPKDPRWLSTLDAIGRELVTDSLVFRYNPSASPDGLPGEEGTFSLCSFFYVYALTAAGRLEEARYAFEKMSTYANHLGLYSEEIDPNGAQLGNFPQAFTHLALIQAATALDAALDRAGGGLTESLARLGMPTAPTVPAAARAAPVSG